MTAAEFYTGVYRVTALLAAATINTRLYSEKHPQVLAYIQKAFDEISALLALEPEFTLILVDDELVANNKRLSEGGQQTTKLIEIMQKKSIDRLSFITGLTIDDLKMLIRSLAAGGDTPVRSTGFIKLGKVGLADDGTAKDTEAGDSSADDELKAMQALREAKQNELNSIYPEMQKHKDIDVNLIGTIIQEFIKNFRRDINPLKLLALVKTSDEYTFTHVVNVCILTMSLAETLGFSGEHLHQIGVAASLHDTGKMFIPKEIMNKPGKLTPKEMKIVEMHPHQGARYLMGLKGIPKLAVIGALEHHIRYDGSGYPAMNGNFKPHIVSQMIAITDAFDAMRSHRVYQGPKPLPQILEILTEEKAAAFNPRLVDQFIRMIKLPG